MNIPREHPGRTGCRTGAITKTGNGPIRRILVEAAGNDRVPARKTRPLTTKAKAAPERVQTLAWQAQKRLCGRYRSLSHARKHPGTVTTAVARELIERVGFVWAIVCEGADRPPVLVTPAGPGPDTQDPSSHDRLRVQTARKNPPSRYAAYLFKIYDPRFKREAASRRKGRQAGPNPRISEGSTVENTAGIPNRS